MHANGRRSKPPIGVVPVCWPGRPPGGAATICVHLRTSAVEKCLRRRGRTTALMASPDRLAGHNRGCALHASRLLDQPMGGAPASCRSAGQRGGGNTGSAFGGCVCVNDRKNCNRRCTQMDADQSPPSAPCQSVGQVVHPAVQPRSACICVHLRLNNSCGSANEPRR